MTFMTFVLEPFIYYEALFFYTEREEYADVLCGARGAHIEVTEVVSLSLGGGVVAISPTKNSVKVNKMKTKIRQKRTFKHQE